MSSFGIVSIGTISFNFFFTFACRPSLVHIQSQIANCSSLYDLEDQMYGATKPRKITLREQAKFAGFDYNTEWKQQSQQKKKKMEGKEKALEVTTSSDSVAKTVEVKPIRFIKVM